jgi:poly-gamma-glutamate biosynthesis protein PgsC/CapC
MSTLLTLSVGIGLAVSMILTEFFGLAAGGMVVPGYVALYLHQPIDVLVTLGTGIVTFLLVHTLSTVTIVYGRRRTVMMILCGFLLGIGIEHLPVRLLDALAAIGNDPTGDVQVIGYIIPGLIGIWIDRQGLIETLSVLLTASVVVRLILILLGMELGS